MLTGLHEAPPQGTNASLSASSSWRRSSARSDVSQMGTTALSFARHLLGLLPAHDRHGLVLTVVPSVCSVLPPCAPSPWRLSAPAFLLHPCTAPNSSRAASSWGASRLRLPPPPSARARASQCRCCRPGTVPPGHQCWQREQRRRGASVARPLRGADGRREARRLGGRRAGRRVQIHPGHLGAGERVFQGPLFRRQQADARPWAGGGRWCDHVGVEGGAVVV